MINHRFIRWVIFLFLISSVGSCKSWFKCCQKTKAIIQLRKDTIDIRHRTLTTYQKYYVYELLYILQKSCPLHFKSLTLHILTFLGIAPSVPCRLTGHEDQVNQCCLSADDCWLASADWTGTIRLWRVDSGRCVAILAAHIQMVNRCVFSPDTRALLSSSEDTTIKQWAVPSGALVQTFTGHTRGVTSFTISTVDGGLFLLSVGGDIRQWHRPTGACVRVFTTSAVRIFLWGQFWNQDEYILSSGVTEEILTWSVRTGKCVRRLTGGHTRHASVLAVAPNQQLLLSGGRDCRLCIWRLTTGDRVQTFDEHACEILAGCFLVDNTCVASADYTNTVLVWTIADGAVLHRFMQSRSFLMMQSYYWRGAVECITVYAVNKDEISLLDVTSGDVLHTVARARTMTTLAVSSDGRFMVLGSIDGSVYIRDLK